jgi:hypothetical protein
LFRRVLSPAAAQPIQWHVTESLANTPIHNFFTLSGRDNQDKIAVAGDVFRRVVEIQTTQTNEQIIGATRQYDVIEQVTGRVRHIDPVTGARSWGTDMVYPLLLDVNVNETIATGTDDGFSNNSTWYSTNVYTYLSNHLVYDPAWRFQTVAIPQAATIDSATLTINITTAGNATGTIYGHNVDDAPSWAHASGNTVDAMAKTAATASADVTPTGLKVYTVTTIIQEIVNRGSWASNNNLRLGIQATAGTTTGSIESLENVGTTPAVLDVNYTAAGGGPTVQAVPTMRVPNIFIT